jgi:hypothetical protein
MLVDMSLTLDWDFGAEKKLLGGELKGTNRYSCCLVYGMALHTISGWRWEDGREMCTLWDEAFGDITPALAFW